ncbi:MAG: glycosyltransferase [Ignavibacteria bacterium]
MKILLITIGGWENRKSRTRMKHHFDYWVSKGENVQISEWHYKDKSREQESIADILERCRDCDITYIYRSFLPQSLINSIRRYSRIIIFDFDDAVYCVSSKQSSESFKEYHTAREFLKRLYRIVIRGGADYSERKKTLDKILGVCDGVIAGSTQLYDYSKRFCKEVIIAPTPVRPEETDCDRKREFVSIGWYGNPDGYHYLDLLRNVFTRLGEKYKSKLRLKIISEEPFPSYKGIETENILYNKDKKYVLSDYFDIGIMPLGKDCWSNGKCGYKLLKYMGCGLPVVATNTGFNKSLIRQGENGYLADNDDEWEKYLGLLIESEPLRYELGKSGYKLVRENFTFEIIQDKVYNFLLRLFNENKQNNSLSI